MNLRQSETIHESEDIIRINVTETTKKGTPRFLAMTEDSANIYGESDTFEGAIMDLEVKLSEFESPIFMYNH